MTATPPQPLNRKTRDPRAKLFVLEYLKDLNASAAAIRAGYSAGRGRQAGYELLSRPWIVKEVQKHMDKRAKRVEIDAEYVLETIRETIEACKAKPIYSRGEIVYIEDELGQKVPLTEMDAAAVLKGCELLGKHLKLFTDKVEHSGGVNVSLIDEFLE